MAAILDRYAASRASRTSWPSAATRRKTIADYDRVEGRLPATPSDLVRVHPLAANAAGPARLRHRRRRLPRGAPRHARTGCKEMDYLKRKVDAGADYICTQLFFDNRDFYDFRERCELAGIKVPIVAGIMPITSKPGMVRMAELAARRALPGAAAARGRALRRRRRRRPASASTGRPSSAATCSTTTSAASTSTRSTAPTRPGRSTRTSASAIRRG